MTGIVSWTTDQATGLVVGAAASRLADVYRAHAHAVRQRYFVQIAVHLGAGDSEAAQRLIEQHLCSSAGADAVARGLQLVLQAVCDDARICIAALVAEHSLAAAPNGKGFKHVGSLLAESEPSDLAALRTLIPPLHTLALRTERVGLAFEHGPGQVVLVGSRRGAQGEPELVGTVPVAGLEHDELSATAELLRRHSMCDSGSGGVQATDKDWAGSLSVRLHGRAIALLATCLSVRSDPGWTASVPTT